MPKEEWGVKRVCPKCAVRFYDLQKDPMTCPSCEVTFDLASLTQQKTRTVAPEKVTPKPVKTVDESEVDDAEVVLDDDAENILAEDDDSNDSNLGDDILDEEEDTVNLDGLADVPANDDET